MEMKVDSQLIRAEREKRAWSQEHLARIAGLGLRTVQRIETTGVASYESVKAIAAVFETPVSDLIVETAASPSKREHLAAELGKERPSVKRRRPALPALALAFGVLGGTGAAVLSSDSFWWVGPLVLASAIVIARVLDNLIRAGGKSGVLRAVYLGTTCFLATTLVAFADPALVAMMIPLLGGASVVVLSEPLGCLGRRSSSTLGA